MAKLASLLVDLQLETASLKQGVDQAKSILKGLEGSLSGISDKMKAFGALSTVHFAKEFIGDIVSAGKEVAEFVKRGAELEDQMGKMAQAAGVSSESFSRLSYAARMNHIANEDLGVAFNKLNKHIAEAASGNDKAEAMFKNLGVSVKDSSGHARSADAVFADLAEVFSGLEDGPNKSALALEIFGKAGTKLLPVLNEGAARLGQLGDEAERFGVAVGGEQAEQAAQFEQNLQRLTEISDGLAISIANELIPALNDLISTFTDHYEDVKKFGGALASIGGGVAKSAISFLPGGSMFVGAMQMAANIPQSADSGANVVGDVTITSRTAKRAAPGLPNLTELGQAKTALEALHKELRKLTSEAESVGQGPLEKMMARLDSGDLSEEIRRAGAAGKDLARDILIASQALLDAQLSAEKIKLDFQTTRSMNALGVQQTQRRQDYNLIGVPGMASTLMKTQGFANFDVALQALAANTQKKLAYEAEAHLREMAGDVAGAQQMMLLADAAGVAADKANKAADGWAEYTKVMKDSEEALARRADELSKTFAGTIQKGFETYFNHLGHNANPEAAQNLAGTLASPLTSSRTGGVINAGMQGAAAGGLAGAVVGSVTAVLEESKQFKQIMSVVDEILQMVADALGQLLTPLIPIIGAVKILVGVLMEALQPVFDALAQAMQGIAPIIMIVAKILKAVMPAIMSFALALSLIVPIFDFLGKTVMPPLFEALKFVSGIILTVVKVIMDVWNGIIDAIDSVFNSIADISVFGAHPFGFLKDLFGGLKIPTDGLTKAQDELSKMTYKDANAAANAAGGLDKLNEKAEKFNQELTNIPQGFKYYLRAYESANPNSASGVGGNTVGVGGTGASADKGANGEFNAAHVTINNAGSVISTGDLIDMIKMAMLQAGYIKTGSPFGTGGG